MAATGGLPLWHAAYGESSRRCITSPRSLAVPSIRRTMAEPPRSGSQRTTTISRWCSGWPATAGRPPSRPTTGSPCSGPRRRRAVQWLAGNGGSVIQPANGGTTPLWIAAQEGYLAVVQWLADNGGAVTQPATGGTTLLWIAAQKAHLAVVQCLAVQRVPETESGGRGQRRVGHPAASRPMVGSPRSMPRRKRAISSWHSGWPVTAGRSPSQPTAGPPRSEPQRTTTISRWRSGCLATAGRSPGRPTAGPPLSPLPRLKATMASPRFSPPRRHGQPPISWRLAVLLTMPSSRSAPAGSIPVPAHLARQTRRRQCEPRGRTLSRFTRRLSGHEPARPRRHGAPDAVSALYLPPRRSQPHRSGADVREPGSRPG